MFGIGLLIIFLLHFAPSLAQSCSSEPPNGNLNSIFSRNSGNEEDIAKFRLIKKCLSNLKDCAKGISLKTVIQEVTSTSDGFGEIRSTNFCEGKTGNISCSPNLVVKVHDGFYGRMDNITCPSENIKTTNCKANDSLIKLKHHCNNHQTCNIESSNSKYGNPCNGTNSYVSVTYSCQIADNELAQKKFSLKGSNRTFWLTSKRYNNSNDAKEHCEREDGILATFDAKSCVNRRLIGSYTKFFLSAKEKVWMKKRKVKTKRENSQSSHDVSGRHSSNTISPTQIFADGSKCGDCILMDTETFQAIESRQGGGDLDHHGLCEIEIPPIIKH